MPSTPSTPFKDSIHSFSVPIEGSISFADSYADLPFSPVSPLSVVKSIPEVGGLPVNSKINLPSTTLGTYAFPSTPVTTSDQ